MTKLLNWTKEKRIQLSLLPSIVILILCSIGTAFFVIYIAPESARDFIEVLKQFPLLFFLNYIPILLLMLLLFFLFNNAVLSITISAAVFSIAAIINRVKIVMRQDPLLPTDVSHIREVTAILDKFNMSFVLGVVVVIIAAIAVIAFAVLFFSSKKIKLPFRLTAIAVLIGISIGVNNVYYASETLYNQFPVNGNIYFQVNHYISKGFLYSFVHNFNTLSVKKPDNYSPSVYAKIESTPPQEVQTIEKKPHIIMVMGEAFSDLSINDNLDFTNYIDPLKNYKQLCAQKGTISGHIVVPNFGGGTSDTEFDVLTACPTRFIGNSLASYSFVRQNFDALPRELKKLGYDTLAIHPGFSWFYNRYNVYNYFGFNDFITLDDFNPQKQSKGGYISEEATIDTILDTFDEHIKTSDNPLFSFCVTIQNHGPYKDKYNETQKNFDTTVNLTKEESNMLYNYFNGVKDVDRELKKMTDHFQASDEPVVLVYFGDHLPGFTNGMDFFDILDYNIDINGTPDQRLGVYETPFLIWQNESAKKITQMEQNLEEAAIPKNHIISANYLGAMVLELLGIEGISPLYDFSNDFRKELPVITNQNFMTKDAQFVEEITSQQQEKVDFLKGWVYYKLFDQKVE